MVNNMKRIMFYINVIDGGGAERVMTNLSSQFADNGYQVTFVTSYPAEIEYQLNKKIKRFNLEEKQNNTSKISRNIGRIIRLRELIKEEKPDLLVTFMGEPNFRGVIAKIGLKTKVVVSVRNDPNKEYGGKVMRFVGKVILPFADGCVFQTEDAKKWFPEKLQRKSTVIWNAVNEDFYKILRSPVKGLVVSCGRLQPQKNHKMLISAIKQVFENYPNVRLNIYGSGNLESELTSYINELGMKNVITLKGQTSNVAEVLKKADIFVMSSDYEGMPNALMEAMASGVPCISTDCPCGGPKMLITDREEGILVNTNDEIGLAKAIEELLSNDNLKENLSIQAKNKAISFRSDAIFNQWVSYIERL